MTIPEINDLQIRILTEAAAVGKQPATISVIVPNVILDNSALHGEFCVLYQSITGLADLGLADDISEREDIKTKLDENERANGRRYKVFEITDAGMAFCQMSPSKAIN
jgi:hypothetical protein